MSSTIPVALQPENTVNSPTAPPPTETTVAKYAALFGVGHYKPGNIRHPIQYGSLKGPPHDVELVANHLIQDFGFEPANIFRLTASDPCGMFTYGSSNPCSCADPKEEGKDLPTYSNMINSLQHITDIAKADDIVYIYYSGHGGQAESIFNKDGFFDVDEGLVPTDINVGGKYLRDVELAVLLQRMVSKGLYVTVILDCCHSGNAVAKAGITDNNSGLKIAIRGIEGLDMTRLSSDASELPRDEISFVLKDQPRQLSQGKEGFWLQPRGYVLLSACRPNEVAVEVPVRSVRLEQTEFRESLSQNAYHGLLTLAILDSLKSALQEGTLGVVTHDMLHRKVLSKVREWANTRRHHNINQYPVFSGSAGRLFLGGRIHESFTFVNVLESGSDVVGLNAGKIHLVHEGDLYGICSWNAANAESVSILATVKVTQVSASKSLATFEEYPADDVVIQPGCQAILLERHIEMKTKLRIVPPQDASNDQRECLRAVALLLEEDPILSDTHQLVIVESDQASTDDAYHLTVDAQSKYQLLDPRRKLISDLPSYDEPNSLLDAAGKLGRFERLRNLENPDEFRYIYGLGVSPYSDINSNSLHLDAGSCYTVIFYNMGMIPLYLTILNFDSLRGITQVHPVNAEYDEVAAPNNKRSIRFRAEFTHGASSPIVDTLKVFITTYPTSFRSLVTKGIQTRDQVSRGRKYTESNGRRRKESVYDDKPLLRQLAARFDTQRSGPQVAPQPRKTSPQEVGTRAQIPISTGDRTNWTSADITIYTYERSCLIPISYRPSIGLKAIR